MKQKILSYLQKLGLSTREAELYWLLLSSGSMTVAELATKAKINRTATYPHLDALLQKGIISEVQKGTRKQLVANDPGQLEFLIKRQEISIHEVQSQFPQMVQLMYQSLPQGKQDEKVEVKYYRGIVGIKNLFEEALQSNELRTYVNIQDVHESIDNTDLFVSGLTCNKKLTIYELLSESLRSRKIMDRFLQQVNLIDRRRYLCKYLPEHVVLTTADTLLYDGKVVIVNFGNKENVTGIVLRNTEYYQNSKEIFDVMWHMLPAN